VVEGKVEVRVLMEMWYDGSDEVGNWKEKYDAERTTDKKEGKSQG